MITKNYLKQGFLPFAAGLLALAVTLPACYQDDDGTPPELDLPVITINDITVTEDDQDRVLQLEVKLTGNNTTNAIVTFSAIAGTAEETFDYEVLTTGKIQFAPGETLKTIDINIVGDEVREPREAFQVKIYNPLNAKLEQDLATITIEDDDNNTAGLQIPTGGYTTPTSYPGYNLVWADEFNGTTLDPTSWTYEIGDGCPNLCGWGNNELQYYREDNVSLVDGHLVITAKKQTFGGRDYTSSRIVTKGKRQFKFGRVDVRAALPEGKGLWPAIWMLGSNIDAVGWPACGEIDIMELTGDLPNRVLSTVHFGANVSQHQYRSQSLYLNGNDNFQDEFHVFSMIWKADLIEFYVDDVLFYTVTPATVDNAPYPFNKNFFFIMNVAIGGNLPGNPDATTPFPQHMIVDYIRVFQE
jgi:beta-glucanase (GH16 family)